MATVSALHDLELVPYDLTLQELRLVKKFNDHTRLYFTGIVSPDQKDQCIRMTEAQTRIALTLSGAAINSKPLFRGIVLHIDVKAVRDIYYLTVEAVSNTYLLDVKRKSRSFQDTKMTYKALVEQVLADTPGSDFRDTASQGKKTGKFIMQYQETDWQFIKRLASRFHTGLIPDLSSDQAKFYFGLPEGSAKAGLENEHYSVHKRLHAYRNASENHLSGLGEDDFIVYEVENDQVLEVGSPVSFNHKTLYVREAITEMKQSLIKNQYSLTPARGLSQNDIHNSQISGAAIQGRVLDVSQDRMRVHLQIDEKQNKEEACWFPYATNYAAEGSSGWYCMPELGDQVRLYFPTCEAEEGVVTVAVRQDLEESPTNKIGNPDIKYFRTKSGKELRFSPEEIVLTGKDGEVFLKINEQTGIEIFSVKPVKITSQAEISMESQQKIVISAADEINISCRESRIQMNGETNIRGSKVKTN
jgi:phage baseplate assembly protein gpV